MVERFAPKRLNELCGSGLGSRMAVSASNLPSGWRFERRSEKYCVWFDDQGKRYKSSKQVEAAMKERGLLALPSETEAETDTGSEYEPSPTKKPRAAGQPRWAPVGDTYTLT